MSRRNGKEQPEKRPKAVELRLKTKSPRGKIREPLRELQTWIAENLVSDLSVLVFARRVAMSPRYFARVFTREIGLTPGQFVEKMRVEAACRLEESPHGLKNVAVDCGFGSADTMRRAFLRTLHGAPTVYRSRFRTTEA